MIGRVVSTKMAKTVTVLVEGRKQHPLYKKTYVSSKKYLADDPTGVRDGDIVVIEKIAPVSKNKHWRVVKVLGSDMVHIEEAQLQESATEAIEEVMPAEVEVVEKVEEKVVKEKKLKKVSPKKETK